MNFGETLKRLRQISGKSQVEIAAEISRRSGSHFPQSKLSTLENRETLPSHKVIEVLADYFQVPFSIFIADAPSDQEARKAQSHIAALRSTYLADLLTCAPNALTGWQPDYGDALEYLDT